MRARLAAGFRSLVAQLLLSSWACVFVVAAAQEAPAQESGRILVEVREAATGRALASAQVFIPGTETGALTNSDGRVLLVNVSPGEVTVQVQLVGYGAETASVEVPSDGVVELEFVLRTRAISLDEIVVSGTGAPAQRRRLGQTINSVSARDLESAPISSVADALQGRVPGMTGFSMAETGAAPMLILRGTASLSQRNEPLIYVDGIRIDNTSARVSGTVTNRLLDINPSDVDRIEVIKGAAAATLFGTEASSGVIQIFTRRGSAQDPVFTFQVDQQLLHIPHSMWPENAQYSDVAGRVIRDKPAEMFVDLGHQQNYSLSVRGGGPSVQYFLSGRYLDEDGPMPNNSLSNASLRSGFDFTHGERLRFSIDMSWVNSTVGAPQPDWSSQASDFLLSQPARGTPEHPHGRSACQCYEIGDLLQFSYSSNTRNALLSGSMSYDVRHNVVASLRIGHNSVGRRDVAFRPEGITPPGEYLSEGWRRVGNVHSRATTIDASLTWDTPLSDRTQSTLTVGGQGFWEGRIQEQATVQDFAAATLKTLRGGSNVTSVDESQLDVINAGLFVQQQIGLDDRLFFTGGLRMDGNSAFGSDFGLTSYPKAGLSWVVSDHDFWTIDAVDEFRIRGAIGVAGLQPGAFDAQRTWQPSVFAGGIPRVMPLNLGNPDLKPERSTEREVAIEAGLFEGRVGLEAVYFNQTTTDALLPQNAPPSTGFTGSQLVNIGEMASRGVEITGSLRLIEKASFGWDINAAYSWIDQKVTDMGAVPDYRVAGGRRYSWIAEGYRPGVVIAPIQDPENPYTLAVPVDELTDLTQIQSNTLRRADGLDSLVVIGNSLPSWTVNFGSTFRFGPSLSLSALFVGAGGFVMSNETEAIRGSGGLINRFTAEKQAVLKDPASTAEQRGDVADAYGRKHPDMMSSWMEDGDYLRLNELVLNYDLPSRLVSRVGLGRTTVAVGGRNLVRWTKYSGILDPGSSPGGTSSSAFLQNIDYLATPVPRRYVFTFRTTW